MKINYILSDTTKGATTLALTKVASEAENDIFGSYVVIVPETKSIIIEKELLALSKRGSYANVYVYSFVRLLDRIGNVPPEKVLSKQACVFLLRKIIFENLNKLKCYKKTAKTVGFAEKIYETISQFKSSEISPEELKLSLATTEKSLKAKLEDIVFLYEEYEKFLTGNFYDDCGKLSLLSEFAKENEFLKTANVFVVGFDNITFEMQRVLRDLAINSREITFSCVYFNDKRKDKYIQKNELYEKFKHISDELKYNYVPQFQKTVKKGDFYAIQNYLFSTEKHSVKPFSNIEIFEAGSKKREIDFVANTILCCVQSGKRFSDFGVMVTDEESDVRLIEECFDVYKIPYFVSTGRKMDSHFLVGFIKSAFEVVNSDYSSEKVLKFMANPLFEAGDYALYFSFVNETGTNYSDFLSKLDEKYLKSHKNYFDELSEFSGGEKGEDFSEKLDVLCADHNKLGKFFGQFSELLKNAKTCSDYLKSIDFLFKFFSVSEKLEKISNSQAEMELSVESEITKRVLAKLEKFRLSLEQFLGKTEMSSQEFLQVYLSGVSVAKISLAPVSIDCVVVQSNTDGFYNLENMFIVGAVDGKFPCKVNDSGIILDSELDEAKRLISKQVEPKVQDINRRETFRVYEALLEPTQKLYVSYSVKGVSGQTQRPSRIVQCLNELFEGKLIKNTYQRAALTNSDILERRFAQSVYDFKNNKINLEQVNINYTKLGEDISKNLSDFLKTIEFGHHDFTLENASDLYFYNNKTSVTQLETYFDCPYKFFAKYGLKLKESKNAKLNFPDIGTIIHRFAELFGEKITEYLKLNSGELKVEVQKIIETVFEEANINGRKNKALITILKSECERLAGYLLYEQANSGFKIKKSEYAFSDENAIVLNPSGKKQIFVQGKIDRIDEFGDYIRIIDYKTGEISSDLKSIYYGKKIQLPMYLSAAQKYGKKFAGVFYLPVHSEYQTTEKGTKEAYKMAGFILDEIDVVRHMDNTLSETNKKSFLVPITIKFDKDGVVSFSGRQKRYASKEFDTIKNYTEKLCEKAVGEISEGYIEPSPVAADSSDEPTSCEYCKLRGFCGLEKARFGFGRTLGAKIDTASFDDGGEK